jgi:hypothetical protein
MKYSPEVHLDPSVRMTTQMKVEEYPSWIVGLTELHENCI